MKVGSAAFVRAASVSVTLALLGGACDAKSRSERIAEASAKAKALEGDAKSAAKKQIDRGASAAKAALFGLTDTGALSSAAVSLLDASASASGSASIEAAVAKGKQIAPVVVEAKRTMNEAVDEDTAIEPIYQPIEPGEAPKVSESIRAMPRVEVIDGVTVGFKMLDDVEMTKIKKERAVLVMWQQGDHLVGFLYRSRRTIDLEVVVRKTPQLMKLMQAAAK